MLTVMTIRKRLRRMLQRERTAYNQHKGEFKADCLSGCEAHTRWYVALELLVEAIETTGGRVPKKTARGPAAR